MRLVPNATHLFEEPGALEEVAQLARDWFVQHLAPAMRVSEVVYQSEDTAEESDDITLN
jgi:hypothetical protein